MRHLLVLAIVCCSAALPAAAEEACDYSGWAFMPGRYTHDPRSGARVAQYAPPPAVQAFPDSRPHASGYTRSRVNQRGADGTVTTRYQIENWSNRPDRIDAEWERFNDVWQRSVISGGYGYRGYGYGYPGFGGYNPLGGYGPPAGNPGQYLPPAANDPQLLGP